MLNTKTMLRHVEVYVKLFSIRFNPGKLRSTAVSRNWSVPSLGCLVRPSCFTSPQCFVVILVALCIVLPSYVALRTRSWTRDPLSQFLGEVPVPKIWPFDAIGFPGVLYTVGCFCEQRKTCYLGPPIQEASSFKNDDANLRKSAPVGLVSSIKCPWSPWMM